MAELTPLGVYVPRDDELARAGRGAGIVGSLMDTGGLLLDYEANRDDGANPTTFADRVLVAAGRHRELYPTAARQSISVRRVVRVGIYDDRLGRVDLAAGDVPYDEAVRLVRGWLGVPMGELSTQLLTTAHRHVMARGLAS